MTAAATALPPDRTILPCDVLDGLASLPPDSVHCILTSPPYWQLRSYDGDVANGQWGRESTVDEYLAHIDAFLSAARRVLRPDGTLWLNVGDVYSAGAPPRTGGGGRPLHKPRGRKWPRATSTPDHAARTAAIRRKSLIGLPHRIFARAIDSGLIARNDLIWHKPSALPSSVKDRLTTVHEHIFLFAKSDRYYFGLDDLRRPHRYGAIAFNRSVREYLSRRREAKPWLGDISAADAAAEYAPDGLDGIDLHGRQTFLFGGDAGDAAAAPSRRATSTESRRSAAYDSQTIRRHYGNCSPDGRNMNNPRGKNPGDVQAFRPTPTADGSHVAAFPVTLAAWCITAGCPPGGLVLDPFLGSGSTALAAEQTGRRWLGIEIVAAYRDEARRRLGGLHNDRLAPLPVPAPAAAPKDGARA